MTSHHPLGQVSKAFTIISLDYFSDIFHCHTCYFGIFVLPASFKKNVFFSRSSQAHPHISFKFLFRSSPTGEAMLKHYSLCFFLFLLYPRLLLVDLNLHHFHKLFLLLHSIFSLLDLNCLFEHLLIICLLF